MQIVEHFREFVWLPPPPSTRTRLRNGNRLDKKLEEHRKSFDLMGNVFIWKQLQSPPRRIFQTQSQGEGYNGDEDEDVCAGSVESASSVTLDDESVPNVSPLPPPPYAKC